MDFLFICSQNSMFTCGPPHLLQMGVGCKTWKRKNEPQGSLLCLVMVFFLFCSFLIEHVFTHWKWMWGVKTKTKTKCEHLSPYLCLVMVSFVFTFFMCSHSKISHVHIPPLSFVKKLCARIHGHGDLATKHKGYGREDKPKWGLHNY